MKAFLKWVYSKLIDLIIAVLETLKINFELIDLSCSGNKEVVLDHCCMSSLFLFPFFPFALDSPLNRASKGSKSGKKVELFFHFLLIV